MTTNTEKPDFKDEIILDRPQGIYTGENERKRRKSETTKKAAREYDLKQHQRALSLASAFRDGKVKTEVRDWTPEPLCDGTYGSSAMKDLCEDFAQLAADIVQDFTGGK